MAKTTSKAAAGRKKTPPKPVVAPVAKPVFAPSAKAVPSHAMPIYVGILLLLLGVIVGIGIGFALFGASGPNEPPIVENDPLEIIVVSNSDCAVCDEATSFELLLFRREVDFERTDRDIATTADRTFLADFNVNSVPVTLVLESALRKHDPALLNALKGDFKVENGYLVLEEHRLSKVTLPDNPIPVQFLENPDAASCQRPTNGSPLIWEFSDFLCRDCYDALPTVSALLSDFNQTISYDFKHYTIFGQDDDSARASNAALCAADQGRFDAYKKTLFEQFFSTSRPIWEKEIQLDVASRVGIADMNAFENCIDNQTHIERVRLTTGTDFGLAQAFGAGVRLPVYVIDCRYILTQPSDLRQDLCALHPQLSACESA